MLLWWVANVALYRLHTVSTGSLHPGIIPVHLSPRSHASEQVSGCLEESIVGCCLLIIPYAHCTSGSLGKKIYQHVNFENLRHDRDWRRVVWRRCSP
jgi:hypothetical protein